MDNKNDNNNEVNVDGVKTVIGIVLTIAVLLLDDLPVVGILLIIGSLAVLLFRRLRKNGETVSAQSIGTAAKELIGELKDTVTAASDEDGDESDDDDESAGEKAKRFVDGLFGNNDADDDDDEDEEADGGEEFNDSGSGGFLKALTAERKREEAANCEQDHIHAEQYRNLSDDEKRREQLKGMLSAGLIDKKEYNMMLKKYGLK